MRSRRTRERFRVRSIGAAGWNLWAISFGGAMSERIHACSDGNRFPERRPAFFVDTHEFVKGCPTFFVDTHKVAKGCPTFVVHMHRGGTWCTTASVNMQ